MTIRKLAAATVAAALSLGVATQASAQAAAPAAVTQGPPIAGVCILSVEGAIGSSTVGKYVQTRLQQIATQVQAELKADETSINNEAKALDAAKASLDQATLEKRANDLQTKANTYQRKGQQRQREMQATQEKALGRIGQEMDPLIRQAYQQKQCSVLLQREALVIANPAMDLTPQVVTALNAKITQFAFDRERLDQTAPAGN